MMVQWIRESKVAAVLWTVIRVYLGYTWLTAGISKIGGGFNAGGFLQGAVGKATGEHPAVQGWWAGFLESVAIPNANFFTFLVMWGEVLVGLALILGVFTTFSALMGITMNFAFLFSGTTSTNPQMVLLTIFLLIAGWNAGKYGLDRWVIPYVHQLLHDKKPTLRTQHGH
ncbi:Crp/Fnr family transcriptional regulator [Pontibacillus halophilus JSM 076056 = DSM 19796]|uniref:Crp/Fnr family transcriptional regulator n=1 Tax=Pontibacillus halophilus JSM 076056 = DSM 19796 TaxID=1385510 RepID=A0A0A5GRW3_9BACI|nr:DoxX family protein [Pontibacillus halophilus]KGX93978.1 Crp/Fnr family transcriptional regulator [Pontibacillus halophilus JSM 076056 = DSM 19796]